MFIQYPSLVLCLTHRKYSKNSVKVGKTIKKQKGKRETRMESTSRENILHTRRG